MKSATLSRFSMVLLAAFAIALSGCGDSATEPETPTYNDISGSYAGAMAGTSQGIALDATFTLTITQDGGSLGGSYSLTGTLDDGTQTADVQGSGTMSGTIASGSNPSVNLTFESGLCPNYSANFSGSFDTANSRLTISGPVEILSGECEVLLSYSSTIVLTR